MFLNLYLQNLYIKPHRLLVADFARDLLFLKYSCRYMEKRFSQAGGGVNKFVVYYSLISSGLEYFLTLYDQLGFVFYICDIYLELLNSIFSCQQRIVRS